MATAADGDDYKWEPLPGGAVLNGTAVGELLAGQTVTLEIDLRTPDQRERDDVAALWAEIARLRELVQLTTAPIDVALRVDNLVDALEMLTRRVAALERARVAVKG